MGTRGPAPGKGATSLAQLGRQEGKRRNLDGLSPPDLAPAHTPHHWDPTWPRPFQNSSSLTGRLYDPGEASDPS